MKMNKRKIKMFVTLYENILLLRNPLVDYLSEMLPSVYAGDWWEKAIINAFAIEQRDNEKQRYEKNKKYYLATSHDIQTFDIFDISELIDILIFNWPSIVAHYHNNFSDSKIKLLYKIKTIRNDISHPIEDKLSSDDFRKYIKYILDFSEFINTEKSVFAKLNKYIHFNEYAIVSDDSSNDKKRKMLNLIEAKIIDPALKCENLNNEIKESLTRTLIRLEISETAEDINKFFRGALMSSRGEEVYKVLHQNKLLAFEDIRSEFTEIYGS